MRALRLVVSIGNHAARGCVSSGGLQSSRAWATAAGGGFDAVGRGSLVVPHAMYHKRNPYDFRVVRDEDDAELASLSNLDESIDEVDEQRKKVVRGVEAAKTAALKLLAARSHSRKEVRCHCCLCDHVTAEAVALACLKRFVCCADSSSPSCAPCTAAG